MTARNRILAALGVGGATRAAAAVGAILFGAALVLTPGIYAFLFLAVVSTGVLALVLLWTADGEPADGDLARWTYGSFALHLGLSLVLGTTQLAVAYFGPDANTYHVEATKIARHWSAGTPMPTLPFGKEGFFLVLARLYQVFGPHRIAGLVLTSLCAALLVPLIADTTRRLVGPVAARRVVPLVVLLPGILFWTSQLLREAPILLTLALGANLAVRASERVSPARLAALGLTVAVLFTLRANIAYVFAISLVVGLVLSGRHLMAGVATAAVSLVLVVAIVLGGGLGERGYEFVADADLEKVNTLRRDLAATAASGVQVEADVSTAGGSLAYLVIGVPQFLLGPFPWQVRNAKQALGLLEAMTLWYFVPAFVRGVRRASRSAGRRIAVLAAPAVAITIVLTLIIGNLGTIVRERLQVLVFLLPLIALGLVREKYEAPAPEPDPVVALQSSR